MKDALLLVLPAFSILAFFTGVAVIYGAVMQEYNIYMALFGSFAITGVGIFMAYKIMKPGSNDD